MVIKPRLIFHDLPIFSHEQIEDFPARRTLPQPQGVRPQIRKLWNSNGSAGGPAWEEFHFFMGQ